MPNKSSRVQELLAAFNLLTTEEKKEFLNFCTPMVPPESGGSNAELLWGFLASASYKMRGIPFAKYSGLKGEKKRLLQLLVDEIEASCTKQVKKDRVLRQQLYQMVSQAVIARVPGTRFGYDSFVLRNAAAALDKAYPGYRTSKLLHVLVVNN